MTAMSIIYVLFIKDIISTNLTTKLNTDKMLKENLFDLPYDEIIVDFSGVNSMSRDFTNYYLLNKSKSNKVFHEVNIPLNLQDVLDTTV
ncbi:MAG: hypothetical protein AB7O87_08930 [Candidatus Nitrosocosmicus sp.]